MCNIGDDIIITLVQRIIVAMQFGFNSWLKLNFVLACFTSSSLEVLEALFQSFSWTDKAQIWDFYNGIGGVHDLHFNALASQKWCY